MIKLISDRPSWKRVLILITIILFISISWDLLGNWDVYKEGKLSYASLFYEPLFLILSIFILWSWVLLLLKIKSSYNPVNQSVVLIANYLLLLPLIYILFYSYLREVIFVFDKYEDSTFLTKLLLGPTLSIAYILYLAVIIVLALYRVRYVFKFVSAKTYSRLTALLACAGCIDSWAVIYFVTAMIRMRI